MAVFTLTLVRHGETLANKQGIVQGQQDTELSDKGVRQARLLGERLQGDSFTHVYSSDLKRARKTCETILKYNTCSRCQTIEDRRLRERKFGVIEGKHRTEFQAAMRKVKQAGTEFTPSGGESNQELRARGVNFFQDLCQQMLQQVDQGNGNDIPVSVKKRRHTASISSDVFPSPDSVKDVNFAIDPVDFQNNSSICTAPVRGVGGGGGGGEGGGSFTQGERVVRARSRTHPSSGSTSSSGYSSATTGGSTEQLSEQLSPDIHTKDVSVSSQSSASPPLADADIKTIISLPQKSQHGPPNVSLSPIIEHRLPSMSSISSGRNNSFDDSDMPPALLGEVLVVTHGGLLRQLISYFVDELSCKIPGGKNHALQTTPNTGLSKFTVSLSVEGERPMVTCLSIHDQDHLLDQDYGATSHVTGRPAALFPRVDVKPLPTPFDV